MRDKSEPWTESQSEALKQLWIETQLSASAIAIKHSKQIGNRTRNSILGKIHRMGLPMRCPENSHKVAKHRIPPQRAITDGNWG
jgi:hypothetical protein